MDPEDERIQRLLDETFGPLPGRPPPLTAHTLDEVLASRTHVRVLRVLVGLEHFLNLTARDVARRSGASRGRVQEALKELKSLGVVTAAQAPTHAIYRLSDEHSLADAIRALFDREREAAPRGADG